MDNALCIRTLGELTITRTEQVDALEMTSKARALLVYLACTGRPCRREFLAELLWPGRSQAQSLSNLRKLLSELRHEVGPWVCVDRETVRLVEGAPIWLDVAEIDRMLGQVAHPVPADDGLVGVLETALAQYHGDFLDGFDIDSDDFEAWITVERERLRYGVVAALDRLVDEYTRQGNAREGMACIVRLLRLDPLREKTYRQAMRLMAATGQREAALRQFEACQRILRDELGIAPASHTVELAERIRRGEFSAPDPRPAALPSTGMLSHLPGQATSFVGRQAELAELLDRLEDPDCRLLTIGGPGGIGKTRLALEVARRAAPHFANGVCF
ncbi:MAG: BTAD domain-containing putative transcriptional regulator, partial [Anaerolineae bacterium]